ncbi:MAG TPA: carbohydrate ABC transporter permease [Spirochaetia bacterium]|nr:carbohydrate ABC transporter permease [Spirochaetia bacterium]
MTTARLYFGRRARASLPQLLIYLLLIVAALWAIIPVVWMILSSFKTMNTIFRVPLQWIPKPFYWKSYPEAWAQRNFAHYFLNSAIIAVTITVGNLFVCAMAGYGLAKYRFRGRNFLFLAVLSTLMLPLEVTMVPLFLVVKVLHWQNTFAGIIVPFLADPFGVFLMRQYILDLPDDLIEAARIDGMHEFGIFSKIVLPLVKPALTALAIFIFREAWNLYIWPLIIITSESLRPLTVGIALFMSNYGTDWNQLLAIATIAMLPMVVIFLMLQRYFVRGIVLSGMKG